MKLTAKKMLAAGMVFLTAGILLAEAQAAPAPGHYWGTASWYSRRDPGVRRRTASGEIFDDTKNTCASWHFKMGTLVRVTNTANGKSVVCRVNDRGPSKRFKRRIIDLSKASFRSIGPLEKGLIRVKITPLRRK